VSGGTYEPLEAIMRDWRKFQGSYWRLNDPYNPEQERKIAEAYLNNALRCGKPETIDLRRWFLKALSNDQTAFTGWTSLVDVVETEQLGYSSAVNIYAGAAFVEPFVLNTLDAAKREQLVTLEQRLKKMTAEQIEEIQEILCQADKIAPVTEARKKGKSPLFFYGVTDQSFCISRTLYERMAATTEAVYTALEQAVNEKSNVSLSRAAFTGSIDFMVVDNDLYVIDIGVPAVGYIADILAASQAMGRKPEIGQKALAAATGGKAVIAKTRNARELGFFKQEQETLVQMLKEEGIEVGEQEAEGYEVEINGAQSPNALFDYLSRNQPLRNRVLEGIRPQLQQYGAKIPVSTILEPDDFALARFYDAVQAKEGYGLVVKKKVLFKEYEQGEGYFKPLVTPLWSREARAPQNRSVLFEQFVPSLIDVDARGLGSGKRSYEIRMYFVVGEKK